MRSFPNPNRSGLQKPKSLNISQNSTPIISGHLNLGGVNPQGQTIEFTNYYMLRDGTPCIPVMGEFHFSRYPYQDWEAELLKMKAGGIDIVATYVFWIHIEEDEGVCDWSGSRNLRHFIVLCARHQLQALVRIGPFAHGECRNGGLPDWLYGRPFLVRSNDTRYLAYVRRWYNEIAAQLKGLLFKDGGPVIGIQLENEYMHAGAPWEVTFRPGTEWVPSGSDGVAHIVALKQLAVDAGLDVPIYTCTGWLNSPIIEGEILPVQGGYAFTPWSPDPNYRQPPTREFLFENRHLNPVRNGTPTYDASEYPYACCELGSGIQDTYFHRNIVPPESVESLAVVNLAGGANLVGYYMYHGGSNPVGEHSYMNEFTVPRISYDFQAPLREFGQVTDSYRYLRLLHLFLKDFGELLAPMGVTLPDTAGEILPDNTTTLRFAARSKDGSGFLFLSNYQDHVETQDIRDIRLQIQTENETLLIPCEGSLVLRKNVSAILPFGLSLSDILLKYATTQLLTKVEEQDATTYVFFAPRGMVSEYAFDTASYRDLDVRGGETVEADSYTVVTVTPGIGSTITVTSLGGATIRLLTLTRDQAEHCCKQTLWEKERLIITDGTIVTADDNCFLYSTGQHDISLSIFPAIEGTLTTPFGTFAEEQDGFFVHYTAQIPDKDVRVQVTMSGTDRAVVTFPPEVLEGVNNIFLQIAYVGDIGNCFTDGKLVGDNFYNGTPWEIGLKHLVTQMSELLFLITPITANSNAINYVPTGMAFQPDSEAERVAVIRAITAVPEFKIPISRAPA